MAFLEAHSQILQQVFDRPRGYKNFSKRADLRFKKKGGTMLLLEVIS